ncbi:MAG: RodZ domain-containing protein [Vicinamibacterales bacterium]
MPAGARDEADAIRAKAEQDAARIIRDAEERADLLVKERLAYAERELERLRSLRRNIGTLLESSVSALRLVEHLLPHDRARGTSESQSAVHRLRLGLVHAFQSPYRYATVFAVCMVIGGALAAAAWYSVLPRPAPLSADATPRAADAPEALPAVRQAAGAAVVPLAPSLSPTATSGDSPTLAEVSTAAAQSPALTVVLSAERQCWIRATIDGTQVMERLLEPDQQLVLRARERILLRVGDAGALSATINGKPATRFGRPGEVITRQITLQNYSRWLVGLS